jgi:hypothetical protein
MRTDASPGKVRSLVLRVWLEPGAQSPVRVRVIERTPDGQERSVLATASIDEACSTVRSWLETF